MAWGMPLPSQFGIFWPEGDFEGVDDHGRCVWGSRLDSQFNSLSVEEQDRIYTSDQSQHDYAFWVSEKFKREVGSRLTKSAPIFTPVLPHEVPKSFNTVKTYKDLGSLIQLNDRIIAVDKIVKSEIEVFEKCVHEFFPIDLVMPGERIQRKEFFILLIGRHIDSFSPEFSQKGSYTPYSKLNRSFAFGVSKRDIEALAFVRERFAGAHLWRERCFPGLLTCFSDELMRRLNELNVDLPPHWQMREV